MKLLSKHLNQEVGTDIRRSFLFHDAKAYRAVVNQFGCPVESEADIYNRYIIHFWRMDWGLGFERTGDNDAEK